MVRPYASLDACGRGRPSAFARGRPARSDTASHRYYIRQPAERSRRGEEVLAHPTVFRTVIHMTLSTTATEGR